MKVLFVCHRFPYPPSRGGKIRPFNIIRHFHSLGHQVTVASLARSADEALAGQGLAEYCDAYMMETIPNGIALLRMVVRLAGMTPSSMGYFYSPRLARRIREKLEDTQFDLIFVHCSSVAPYVSHVRGVPKILDLGDVDSQKWLTYARFRALPMAAGYWLEGKKLERAERQLAGQFDLVTCTTRAELETFDAFGTGTASGWFPNGVDTEFFAPAAEPYEPDTICFVGRMDYYPNQQAMVDFCAQIFPEIQMRRPAVRLVIVGADPSTSIRNLGDLPGVTVTGSVDDVRPWVHKAALTVAPLSLARGTQNKILESMAMGVPVVASEQASGGIDARAGEHLLVAASDSEFRDCILSLLENPDKRDHFARAGRVRVMSNHTWSNSMKKLDGLLENCYRSAARG